MCTLYVQNAYREWIDHVGLINRRIIYLIAAYDNEDRLLWDPNQLNMELVENYLREVQRPPMGAMGVKSLPQGCHVRDDERVRLTKSKQTKIC